jgi:predicted deacylase
LDIKLNMENEGLHAGLITIPHSSHASAYGRIEIPVYSVKGDAGPTVLLMGGNHGDEYEGQLVLLDWLRKVDPSSIKGQVIVLPQANVMAAHSGRRTSLIDDGNLNRSFGSDSDAGVTNRLAQLIENELISIADVMIDLHSGGSSLMYIPSALIFEDEDHKHLFARELPLLHAFGTPIGLRMIGFPGLETTSIGAAHRHGVAAICAELGGGASVSPVSLEFARTGVNNVLVKLGVIASSAEPKETVRTLSVQGDRDFIYAPEAGLFEPLVDLGAKVEAGQTIGNLWFPKSPGRKPRALVSTGSGWVVCKRHPVPAEGGDCLMHLAREEEVF